MIGTFANFSRLARGGAVVAVLSIGALAMSANDAAAQWRRGPYGGWGPGVAAGVVGGLAVGALAAGAANPYYYGPAYGPRPVYVDQPRCWLEPEDVWNGRRWIRRNVRVCE